MSGGYDPSSSAKMSETMKAVVTTGNGGYDRLVYKDVPKPVPKGDEVLVKVLAAGVNNTEINTRLGWYSKTVTKATNATEEETQQKGDEERADGGWGKPTPFPFIQGTDCCGKVVACGPEVADSEAIGGKRCLIRPCQRGPDGFTSSDSTWMGSDFNGAFAEYVIARRSEVFTVNSDWSDEQLGSIPCAYGTSENMVHVSQVSASDTVLVPGASGGVASATIQLCKIRGATVWALCGRNKGAGVRSAGADKVWETRFGQENWEEVMAEIKGKVDVVIDNIGGDAFPSMISSLKRGGRYVTSGAIAGPIVSLDLRTLYLTDLRLMGTTLWEEPIMPNLVSYIEQGKICPLVAKTFPLSQIVEAQKEFLSKSHVGKYVLIPHHDG